VHNKPTAQPRVSRTFKAMTAEAPSSCRLRVFAATPTLAQRFDPATVDAASIAAAVGITQAEFEAAFDTLEHYFAAVQLQFFEGRLAAVISRAGTMPSGMDRIRCAWTGYLDYSLDNAATYRWCRRARQRYPILNEEMRRRNHGVLLMIQMEFSTLKASHPTECARLAVGMVLETVKAETEARHKLETMRQMLFSTLETFART
jgi:hypothetical protein